MSNGLSYSQHYKRSRLDPDGFWAEESRAIYWHKQCVQVCDFSHPPFAKWFVGGQTNLCYNAVDRHIEARGDQAAIVFVSSETNEERTLTFRELHRDVNRMAAVLRTLGVATGDRIVIYMPMVPETLIAMLACVRIGAIHSVVFAGFSAPSLASRIDDAQAKLVITCDAALRDGKIVPLKHLLNKALTLVKTHIDHIIVLDRGLDSSAPTTHGRDLDYAELLRTHSQAEVPCEWLESNSASYLLYTSGTTARPRGVQRDTGGYAVALAASMKHIFAGKPGETFFSTADLGWVVGHSYGAYGPLIHGMTVVIYEGLPTRPDAGIWWKIAEQTRATVMFSSPTAIRALRKQGPTLLGNHDLRSLRYLFLAGEPLDEPTSVWIRNALGHVEIIDNYWQTETGWPILTLSPGLGQISVRPGSPGFASYGYALQIVDPATGESLPRGDKGVLVASLPLPPGCMSTVWQNDELFAKHYCGQFPGKMLYSTFDYAVQDDDGYYFMLGRADDVINVAGHRLGTREIEEVISSHPAIAEVATIGASDEIKGQVVKCFVVLKQHAQFATSVDRALVIKEIEDLVVDTLGSIARPSFIGIVRQLPKTRSGKIVRRAILAIVEGRDPGDVSTMEDLSALDEIRESLTMATTK